MATDKQGKSDRRQERLKAALRENLRRRKAQERRRGAPDRPAEPRSPPETVRPDKPA